MIVTAVLALFVAGVWLVALTSFLGTPEPASLVFRCGTSLLLGLAGLVEIGTFIFVRGVGADLAAGTVVTGEGAAVWGRGG